MDLFELFESDNDSDRRRTQSPDAPRRKGVRGFFSRWMQTFQDEDVRDDNVSGQRKSRRSDLDFGED